MLQQSEQVKPALELVRSNLIVRSDLINPDLFLKFVLSEGNIHMHLKRAPIF